MADDLEQGRESYGRREWAEAYRRLSRADQEQPLGVEDLELLATAAYLIGRDEDFIRALDRAHHTYLQGGREEAAARCAFWIGLRRLLRGELGPATGWLARAQRLLDRRAAECVERGYLLLPEAEQLIQASDFPAAHAAASSALEIGERFADEDLIACARHLQGRALIRLKRLAEGLAMLDESMVAVTAGELSPVVTGLIYCSVIEACQEVFAVDRARDWTSALARWWDGQPDLIAFTGACLVRRAEVLQFNGAWEEALREARRACERHAEGTDPQRPAAAFYQQGEIHRLRGELAAAEEAYRSASQWGWEPQPGLALLRLAQGQTEAAGAAMRRVIAETTDPLKRSRLLPAHVEILLAEGEIEEARRAAGELEAIGESFGTGVLEALAAQARGAVELAAGEAGRALGSLRPALDAWLEAGAPYLAARARVLMARACRALGDADGAELALDAARAAFRELGAQLEPAGEAPPQPGRRHGLSPRELEVLRLIAAGHTNKAIGTELFISDKTVARHVSNIFNKLGLSTRASAAAYAHRHGLT